MKGGWNEAVEKIGFYDGALRPLFFLNTYFFKAFRRLPEAR